MTPPSCHSPICPKNKIWHMFRLQLNLPQLFIAHAKVVALNLKKLPEVGKFWKSLLRLPAHTSLNHIDLARRNSLLQVVWGTLAFSKCCFNELLGINDGDSEIIKRVRNCQAIFWTRTKIPWGGLCIPGLLWRLSAAISVLVLLNWSCNADLSCRF